MNYTKGLWSTAYRQNSNGMYSQEVFDERGETIAVCAWHSVKTEYGLTTDREANARLIAASPEMYEALKAIMTASTDAGVYEMVERYRGVLAKAEEGK